MIIGLLHMNKCQVKGGASVIDFGRFPPFNHDYSSAKLGANNTMIHKMISDLKSCPKAWWESLPKQG
jgi:hypothetical protein